MLIKNLTDLDFISFLVCLQLNEQNLNILQQVCQTCESMQAASKNCNPKNFTLGCNLVTIQNEDVFGLHFKINVKFKVKIYATLCVA